MKFLILILLIALPVWVLSIAWANRRKTPCDSGSSSGSDSGCGDSGDCSPSYCSNSDSSCDSGGDGGGGGD